MQRFDSRGAAEAFVRDVVDQPVTYSSEVIKPGISFSRSTIDLGGSTFTNSYDLVFNAADQQTEIVAFDALTSVYDFTANPAHRRFAAAAGGGFFYLIDQGSGQPRHPSLNLSISRGNVQSLPVTDRESVIAGHNNLEVRHLIALGSLSLDRVDLDWSGSLTDYDTPLKVYGNGNTVIRHQSDPMTGSARLLDETSRYTPAIDVEDIVDVGFVGREGNNFIGVHASTTGGVDIFAHDFVLRSPQKYIGHNPELVLNTIGGFALSRFEGGAISAGPDLKLSDFDTHPVNRDLSLGSRPPFIDTPLARAVIYRTEDDLTHIRVFDGRPGSPVFPGITPGQAALLVRAEGEIEWGCFLDSGQTAKIGIRRGDQVASYGNRHYMRWPNEENPDFLWVPEVGRPVGNVIAI